MSKETLRILGMAGAILLLAAMAAWLGLAHGCQGPGNGGIVAGRVTIAPALADRVSQGELDAPEFATGSRDEIGTLAQSFTRMRTSVVQAMKMLEN